MDDRDAYILNSLWTKYYDRGRVVRFRHVTRGRQATCFEILTNEQHEYLAMLFPPAFDAPTLEAAATFLNVLDRERFSAVPPVASSDGRHVVGGPQGTSLMVCLNPVGQIVLPNRWTAHDLSQLGLRLAWLHRLAAEQPPELPRDAAGESLERALKLSAEMRSRRLPTFRADHLDALRDAVGGMDATGWCHGDVQPAAFLLDGDHQIRTVMDWGLLHAGDPLEDMVDAFVHWCVGTDGVVNPELGRVLIESYRSLRPMDPRPWGRAVRMWCARRVVDAAHDRRGLPRGFAGYLGKPEGLVGAMEMCEVK